MSASAKKGLHSTRSTRDQNSFQIQLVLAKYCQIFTGPQRDLRTPDTRATMNVMLSRKVKQGNQRKKYEE